MLKILFSQLGAREHYSYPAAAHRHGSLARLVTDVFLSPQLQSRLQRVPVASVQRAAGRFANELAHADVQQIISAEVIKHLLHPFVKDPYVRFAIHGQYFARRVSRHLAIEHDVFHGYSCGSLETIAEETTCGRPSVLSQIDPARVESQIVLEEERRFPSLVQASTRVPEYYFDRQRAEWDAATIVIVNSKWAEQALIEQGLERDKIRVVPLAYSIADPVMEKTFRCRYPSLRVLWLGTVCLRKGIPYLLEAARRLVGSPVSFTIAGPSEVIIRNLAMPANVSYIGPVPRTEASKVFREHDVFVLPTLSDGFGISQLEALAHGLPVIATENCGRVVEDYVNGFIVAPRDSRAIADRLQALSDEPELLMRMSRSAIKRANDFTPDKIWPMFLDVLNYAVGSRL